ncbi:hypothetical protein OG439_27760 [Amycolatopsis sp. NBC_01307]|uniref:hypothetical protein n=1 Tax=Amycolatopsis sp. NBC_01307 TaxID=2903561 RepID=UPI002E154839|nr:hypothetical protein OG439_27760 [Amycolatopsis sp. NBC_01307]
MKTSPAPALLRHRCPQPPAAAPARLRPALDVLVDRRRYGAGGCVALDIALDRAAKRACPKVPDSPLRTVTTPGVRVALAASMLVGIVVGRQIVQVAVLAKEET